MQSLAALLGPAQVIDLKARTSRAAVTELVKTFPGPGMALRRQMIRAVLEREATMSTGIGNGIAVPHARLEKLSRIHLALGRSQRGIDFQAVDGRKASIVALIITPTSQVNAYLQLLASVLWTFSDDATQGQILSAPNPKTVLAALARRRTVAF